MARSIFPGTPKDSPMTRFARFVHPCCSRHDLDQAWSRLSYLETYRINAKRTPPGESRAACVGERAGGYSVLLNSAMATPSMTSPMTATMASDSQIGTTQPFQVIPGDRWAKAAGLMFRWENTACRIGPTT
jgi:hypothetical protein